MFFGVSNAFGVFMEYMNMIFHPYRQELSDKISGPGACSGYARA